MQINFIITKEIIILLLKVHFIMSIFILKFGVQKKIDKIIKLSLFQF